MFDALFSFPRINSQLVDQLHIVRKVRSVGDIICVARSSSIHSTLCHVGEFGVIERGEVPGISRANGDAFKSGMPYPAPARRCTLCVGFTL